MKKVKIGFLPLYVKLYDDGSPNMRVRHMAYGYGTPKYVQSNSTLLQRRYDVERKCTCCACVGFSRN